MQKSTKIRIGRQFQAEIPVTSLKRQREFTPQVPEEPQNYCVYTESYQTPRKTKHIVNSLRSKTPPAVEAEPSFASTHSFVPPQQPHVSTCWENIRISCAPCREKREAVVLFPPSPKAPKKPNRIRKAKSPPHQPKSSLKRQRSSSNVGSQQPQMPYTKLRRIALKSIASKQPKQKPTATKKRKTSSTTKSRPVQSIRTHKTPETLTKKTALELSPHHKNACSVKRPVQMRAQTPHKSIVTRKTNIQPPVIRRTAACTPVNEKMVARRAPRSAQKLVCVNETALMQLAMNLQQDEVIEQAEMSYSRVASRRSRMNAIAIQFS